MKGDLDGNAEGPHATAVFAAGRHAEAEVCALFDLSELVEFFAPSSLGVPENCI